MIDLVCSFFVVTNGKPAFKLKRIWSPKTLSVPVPVLSSFFIPSVKIRSQRSRYVFIVSVQYSSHFVLVCYDNSVPRGNTLKNQKRSSKEDIGGLRIRYQAQRTCIKKNNYTHGNSFRSENLSSSSACLKYSHVFRCSCSSSSSSRQDLSSWTNSRLFWV